MNRKPWWLLYSLVLVGYLYVSWPVFQYATTSYQFLEYEHIPVMTVPQMKAELERLQHRVNNPGDPTQYCENLMDLRLLSAAAVKRDLMGPSDVNVHLDVRVIAGRANDLMQANYQTYFNKHGSTTMGYATAAYWNANPEARQKYAPISNRMPFLAHLLYLNALSFVAVFFLMRLHANGYSLLGELRHRPHKILLAIAWWPAGIFTYPTGEPVRLLINWVRVRAQALGYGLASIIGLFAPGIIKAQEKPPEKKQTGTVSWQTDFRVSALTSGDGPTPNGFARLTGTGSNWFLETVHVASGDGRGHELIAGPGFNRKLGRASLRVNLFPGIGMSPGNKPTFLAGVQTFLAGKIRGHSFFWGTPVLRFERRGGQNAFNWRNEAHFNVHGRFWVGGEFGLKNPTGAPAFWSGGPAFRFALSQRFTFEAAQHWDHQGRSTFRMRTLIALHP